MGNLDNLKAAYAAWDACKGADPNCWLDLLADDVSISSIANEARALSFAGERKTRSAAAAYFTGLAEHWTMVHWTPKSFVSDGDQIAVYAVCAWTSKLTGKTVETPSAHFWQFENGKATSVIEIFDSARVLAAATP